VSAPSERDLKKVERELRGRPGAQKAVGERIYTRLDRSGRRRFQFRAAPPAAASRAAPTTASSRR